jgi:dual specificity tyrosine-phosphorylation-regulated kinase 2/3/4
LQVWFLGKADVQKIKGNPHLQKTNFGYDDERGDYQVVNSDHIAYRYEVQGVLGKGSFGQVLKVLDYKTGTYKALKVIRNKKRFHHQVRHTQPMHAASHVIAACADGNKQHLPQ